MMNKLFKGLLCFALCFSLAACNTSLQDSGDGGTSVAINGESDDNSGAGNSNADNSGEDDNDDDNADDSANNSGAGNADESADNSGTSNADVESEPFAEVVAFDNELCSITLADFGIDEWGGFTKLRFENKSEDLKLVFYIERIYINGIEAYSYFTTDIPAGKKANETLYFDMTSLEKNGVLEITDVEIVFTVREYENYENVIVEQQRFNYYPLGEENATKYARELLPTDILIADNEYVTAIITGFNPNTEWGYSMSIVLTNNSDVDISVMAEDVSINDYMMDAYFWVEIAPEKTAITSMDWSEDTFIDNDIDKVEEIEFTLVVGDMENWMGEPLDTIHVILNTTN